MANPFMLQQKPCQTRAWRTSYGLRAGSQCAAFAISIHRERLMKPASPDGCGTNTAGEQDDGECNDWGEIIGLVLFKPERGCVGRSATA
ncbi:MAG: hypothetical protein RML49_08385 [Verrucomicrobiae bacterium]|nr:hypothetical protein [Verrucomicrobiae bacterium]